MALALTSLANSASPRTVWNPSDHKTYADLTADGAVVTTSSPFQQIRVFIYVKTYVVGSATVGPIFSIVDSNSVTLATQTLLNQTGLQAVELLGQVPVSLSTTYKIDITLNGSATIVYDAMVDVR